MHKYTSVPGAYTDSYCADLPIQISFPEYLFAFYTTPLFKLERLILLLVRKPSTDAQAGELANGVRDTFAAWTVEARAENQILMCDFAGSTRSWLMVVPMEKSTRLYFGSVVVPQRVSKDGKSSLGFIFSTLLGFHKIYSVLLLASARSRLMRRADK
ncbi:MAG: hypothetical protein DPW18_15420 [Chloroflexi bacterium]|nr:hypothetical protein [Chloroflexota bacterium]MDL1911400.1 hypothetical protein [Chloroflexi bacterium CFX6]